VSLLVVAGEASGDRAAAQVVSQLRGARAFGLGGGALEREGVELVSDLRDLTALGLAEVAVRAYGVGLAYAKIRAAIALRSPRAALLVSYTEFNSRIARVLWRKGVRVLWYGAPQIWAWRVTRAEDLRRHVDRMAVMLPFEEELWRSRGVDAHYVGHPAMEELRRDREARVDAREMLGMTALAAAVAILPGSRPHEVTRLLEPMLAGYEAVRRDRASVDGRVLLAPSLDARTRDYAREVADRFGVEVVDVDPRAGLGYALPAFDAALCASGTASLECALARAVPVVCYRVGVATELGARALMTTPHIALPNVLLGRAAFPELLQRDAEAQKIAEALTDVLDERAGYLAQCQELENMLEAKSQASLEVANMLEPWLV
jgi:lipid-A-disaccharide synthase